MKIILAFLLNLSLAQAANFDYQSFVELSQNADHVMGLLQECAKAENISLKDLYPRRLSSCEKSTRQSLKFLKDSFKLFTLSALVDTYQSMPETGNISPLLVQIIAENISQFNLEKTKEGGGSRGIGLCTRFISIGLCSETPTFEISPEIKEEHEAFLKLFDLIPSTQCQLGIFPEATVTLLNEIADAQGLVSGRARNNVYVKDGLMIIGPKAEELNGRTRNKNNDELLRRLDGKFFMSCALMPVGSPSEGRASAFFRSQASQY